MGDSQGLAVHRDILALVALGEVGDGRVGRRLRRNRRLSGFWMRAMMSVACCGRARRGSWCRHAGRG